MDSAIESVRELPSKEFNRTTDTREMLARASRQRDEYNLADYRVVDIDAHHFENQSWSEIVERIPDPVIKHVADSFRVNGRLTPGIVQTSAWPSHQNVGGRIPHDPGTEESTDEEDTHRQVALVRRALDSIGIDCQISFPTPMLGLGMHPEQDVEVAIARAYNRWITEQVVSIDDRIRTSLYLPFNDPPACEQMVQEFGETKGVLGFTVTSIHYRPVHHNSYMRLYAMLEERGLPLSFHAGPYWGGSEGFLRQLNRFISAHALSFTLCNMVHLANWVMNGLNERFPKLNVVWIESGIAWLAFMTQRFDNEYMMRSSEAPALKRLPSEYMREMYYTTQPMERGNMELLEATFKAMNGETQFLYASDWPHWDFDLPSTILDLPFLDDQAKRNILGLNAERIYKI